MNVAFFGAEAHFVYTGSSHFFTDALVRALGPIKISGTDWRWVHFDNFVGLAELIEERIGRRVELLTVEALSPYIGPRILKEVEYLAI